MVAFVVIELRQARPMFDLSLFRNSAFTGVSLSTFAIGCGMFAAFPYITFYLQNALGYSPLGGGLRLLPSTLMAFFVPLVLGRVGDRAPGGLLLVAGLALSGTGLLLMSHLSAGSGWTALLAGLVVAGVGIGVANPAIGRLALGVVAPQRSGMASGISNTFRIAGLTTGVAALGALFQHRLGASLGQQLGHASPGLTTQVASEGVRAASRTGLPAHVLLAAYATGTNEILFVGGLVVLAGAVLALTMVGTRDRRPVPAVIVLTEAAGRPQVESQLTRGAEATGAGLATGRSMAARLVDPGSLGRPGGRGAGRLASAARRRTRRERGKHQQSARASDASPNCEGGLVAEHKADPSRVGEGSAQRSLHLPRATASAPPIEPKIAWEATAGTCCPASTVFMECW